MIMKLKHPHLLKSSDYYWIQLEHRKTAVNFIIECIENGNSSAPSYDTLANYFGGIMTAWGIETVIQGAFIREYHIWEKDTKEYFCNQLSWNGNIRNFSLGKKKGPHLIKVQEGLALFSAKISDSIMDSIEQMRLKINKAKHRSGVLVDDFVSRADHEKAVAAIGNFWQELARQEMFEPHRLTAGRSTETRLSS
jgi:hypothetical protein